MEELSEALADDHDFWPAYAEAANELEAASPLDVRDDVRRAILHTMQSISRARVQMTDDAPS